jgi:hypothetical protein
VTITGEGRVFVTGSQGVYEILVNGEKTYRTARDSDYCSRRAAELLHEWHYGTGKVAVSGLYSHMQWKAFTLSKSFLRLTKHRPELGHPCLLGLAELAYKIDSYIVRADLGHQNLSFSDAIKLPGKCFANGLDADEQGSLYTAYELFEPIKFVARDLGLSKNTVRKYVRSLSAPAKQAKKSVHDVALTERIHNGSAFVFDYSGELHRESLQ